MLRIHLFSIFTIKTPRALAAFKPLDLFIVKTLTNVLLLLHVSSYFRFATWVSCSLVLQSLWKQVFITITYVLLTVTLVL